MADATTAAAANGGTLEEQLQDEQQVKRFAKYLHAAIPLREAVQLSKRVNYFRGKKLIELLLNTAEVNKNKPVCANENEAKMVGLALLKMGLIHASEVADKKKRELRPVRSNAFHEDGFYTWIYEGSKTMRNIMLGVLVFSIAAMCLFPIWPAKAKVGIWYVAVTLLIFLFVLMTVRLVVYIVFWTLGFEFWILPNFFDEDLGVADSFRPVVSFEKGDDLGSSWYFRGSGFVLLLAFGYWCSQQPTEFDELYAQQMDFLSELYDGKLLGDQAQMEEEAAKRAVPDLEELQRQIEREAAGEDVDAEEDLDEDEAAIDSVLEAEAEAGSADGEDVEGGSADVEEEAEQAQAEEKDQVEDEEEEELDI